MDERFSRTALLIGQDALEKLGRSRVAVFGAGGVGGYVIEALARSGIGQIDITDRDTVALSNINRQIIALDNTVGRYKADAAAERARLINPGIIINTHNVFFTPENAADFDFTQYDYVIDAVDTVSAKIEIVMQAQKNNVVVYYADQGKTVAKELHATLTPVLADLQDYENIFQCHRSFVVNLNNITSAKGNSNGYQLMLGKCTTAVPVSRTYVPRLKSFIA